MLIALHKNARTTPAVRGEIAAQQRDCQCAGPALRHHRADRVQMEEALCLWRPLAHGASPADGAHDLPPPAIPISWREVQGFAG